MPKKTRQDYIRDLQAVQQKVVDMGGLAREAVEHSIEALLTGNKQLAQKVMAEDDAIDDCTVEIEDNCLLLVAKQQPLAHDLRVIATGFKISTDIERIGDHAFDIARTVQDVNIPLDKIRIQEVRELADCAIGMVSKAMEAYQHQDIQTAEVVCHLDQEMDSAFARTLCALSEFITGEVTMEKSVLQLLFIARFLERIGDHAVNIAEWVIYLETAERVRQRKHHV